MARIEATWLTGATSADLERGVRYIWHEGGTRSSKTFSIAIALVGFALKYRVLVSVVRISLPVLKKSALRDYLTVLDMFGELSKARYNKTDQVVTLSSGSQIEFFGVDDEQKVRGSKRDILHMNEANEVSDDKRRQLWLRTTRTIIVDHNPIPDDDHWILTRLQNARERGDATYYHSTYIDNPYLEDAVVREIEAMKYDDPYGWDMLGLGKRGQLKGRFFETVGLGRFDPASDTFGGVDFGWNHPFVVAEFGTRDASPPERPRPTLYVRPWFFGSFHSTPDVIEVLRDRGCPTDLLLTCDSAEPDRIAELTDAGYNAVAVEKRQGFTNASRAWLRRFHVVVDEDAPEAMAVRNQLKKTRHKPRPGTDKFLDEVVKLDDDVYDAARYGAFENLSFETTPSMGYYSILNEDDE